MKTEKCGALCASFITCVTDTLLFSSQFSHFTLLSMNRYRFTLERYRGLSTRYTCPQCGRKHTFTRYIDTENNNKYISDNVGKCNRLDKCGYHYTPRQYFTDNPWLREERSVPSHKNIGFWDAGTGHFAKPNPAPLRGRTLVFFPDEGKGCELWCDRLPQIAKDVGFRYQLSLFMEGKAQGGDIADLVDAEDVCPF